jgi:hypothetical protein
MYNLLRLQHEIGLHFMGGMPQLIAQDAHLRRDPATGLLACDAQPGLVTTSNSGIPTMLSTYIDPKVIDVLVSPMNAALIIGEAKKGDWLSTALQFLVRESTGSVAAYGDYNSSGRSGSNMNFPQRQTFHYQTVTEWGEKEAEMAGLAMVDWVNNLNIASVLTLNKYQNYTYFNGVANLQIYGLLNDPNLNAAITPVTKTAGGTVWTYLTPPNEINSDVQKLFAQLNSQAGGNLKMDTKMTLALSTVKMAQLANNSTFSINALALIKTSFPNLSVQTAPEYTTGGGELMQLIVDEFEGQKTADCVFTEKLRSHSVVTGLSSWTQKKSQGTAGCVIYRPAMIAQMLGI